MIRIIDILIRIAENGQSAGYIFKSYVDQVFPASLFSLDDTTGIIRGHDGLFRISAGLYYNVFITNTIEFLIDNVRYFESENYYNDGYYSYLYDGNGRKNFLYSDNLTLAFGNPQTNLFLIAFTCFGQTDKRLNGREKTDFMVSAVYEQIF